MKKRRKKKELRNHFLFLASLSLSLSVHSSAMFYVLEKDFYRQIGKAGGKEILAPPPNLLLLFNFFYFFILFLLLFISHKDRLFVLSPRPSCFFIFVFFYEKALLSLSLIISYHVRKRGGGGMLSDNKLFF